MRKDQERMNDNVPGKEKRDIPNDNYQQNYESAATGNQGRASFHPGSTTQGGSNYGQGSHHLGGESYHQGDTANAGSNYSNEAGSFNEDRPIRREKDEDGPGATNTSSERGQYNESRTDIPHGQGAHTNEKESNAQEDYPGMHEPGGSERDII